MGGVHMAKKPLRPPVPELWGPTRVAQELGVARPNLYRISDLPEPAMTLEPRGTLWYAAEIRDFARKRKRKRMRKGIG